jgi:hypothetical protein
MKVDTKDKNTYSLCFADDQVIIIRNKDDSAYITRNFSKG